MQLRGTTGLLTGAAGGIGSAIAARLAREGVTLALSGRDVGALEALAGRLEGEGHAVVPADLASREDVDALLGRAEQAVGPLDLLVNNAGIEISATYHRLTPAELDRTLDVNLRAPMHLTHGIIGGMLERGRGHVVQISSVAGLVGPACEEPYAATKGALVRLTESLRATYHGEPVGFSTVCPGFAEGGGMYSRMAADGHRSNMVLGTTTVEAVADTVVAAITGDRPLSISSGRPLRPLLAFIALAPGAGARAVDRAGANRIFRGLADARERG